MTIIMIITTIIILINIIIRSIPIIIMTYHVCLSQHSLDVVTNYSSTANANINSQMQIIFLDGAFVCQKIYVRVTFQNVYRKFFMKYLKTWNIEAQPQVDGGSPRPSKKYMEDKSI